MTRRTAIAALGTCAAGLSLGAVRPATAEPAPSLAPLAVDASKRWFAAGGQRVDYREISAFSLYSRWLQGQQGHVRQWATRARAHQVSAVRVLLTLAGPYWESQPIGWFGHGLACGPQVPGFRDQLVPFVGEMGALGLRVRLVLLGDLRMFVPPDRWPGLDARRDALDETGRERIRQYVRSVVGTLAGHPNVIWEVANEYANIGMADSAPFVVELGTLVDALDADALVNLSAAESHRRTPTQWLRPPADFVSAHVDRDRSNGGYAWLLSLAGSPAVAADRQPTRMPFLSGEPVNFGDPRRDGRSADVEPSAAIAFTYGALSRVLRINTTFHHDDGLWTAGWGERTERALSAWRQGLDAVPMSDVPAGDSADPDWPWLPSAPDETALALYANGPYGVAVGGPAGWDVATAVKPDRRARVVARVAGEGRETVVVIATR